MALTSVFNLFIFTKTLLVLKALFKKSISGLKKKSWVIEIIIWKCGAPAFVLFPFFDFKEVFLCGSIKIIQTQ